jgi:hypothetical protein
MEVSSNNLACDGCGLPASPPHIADRLSRLELSTRFRPVHISVLFVALAPPVRPEDEFYSPVESLEFAEPFLDALGIHPSADHALPESHAQGIHSARLAEFQRRGYYLAYLSECPIPETVEPTASTIARLAPTLIRRILFNYRPKQIAPLGQELFPLVDTLRIAGITPILTLDQGLVLPAPRTGDRAWLDLFQKAVAFVA